MDYYIILNKTCNLNCAYCFRKKTNSNENPTKQLILDTAEFILSHNSLDKKITFHGGEPLLSQDIIHQLISHLNNAGITFVLYTNGTLLGTLDPWILNKLHYLTISIDGEEKFHDKYRGKGTYQTIMHNLAALRFKFSGHIMGRMTLPLDSEISLWNNVTSIINSDFFDSVTWQIENTAEFHSNYDLTRFIQKYEYEMSMIIDYWLDRLSAGHMLNILPIQAVVKSYLLNRRHEHFRCGCGSELIFIDLTNKGNCYACDELVDTNQFILGNIHDGIRFPNKLQHIALNQNCFLCDIKYICGGRCLRSCSIFPKERFYFYCKTIKALVYNVERIMPKIVELINERKIEIEKLFCPAAELIEDIP